MLHRLLMLAAVGAAALAWTVSAADAKVGRPCGGILPTACGPGEWCDPRPGLCRPNAPGRCVIVPHMCPDLWKPVCGCNGWTYTNDCWRQGAREAKRHDGPCRSIGPK
jgi:hypothetical protein